MSDVVPGTMVSMRTLRRFSHYMAGEIIAMPFDAAKDLEARRLAQPLHLLVPVAAAGTEENPPASAPLRNPTTGLVRK